MRNKIITGIDIGSSSIRIIVSELVKGEAQPRVLSMTNKKSRGLRHGYIVDTEEACEALREAIQEAENSSGKKNR